MKRSNLIGPCVGLVVAVMIAGWLALPAMADDPKPPEEEGKLRIIAFGAHPDDCEFKVGGTAAKWAALGHRVKLVSVTNGDIGHWRMAGGPLAQRRTAEVHEAAKRLGITAEVLDIHDGELMPTLENRRTITRLIREWKADIVLSHRPNDYHPDHRYTGVLVQDSAYMVAVPFFCPDTPALERNPVFLYYSDGFQKPNPFEADVAVSIDDVFAKKIDAVDALVSQVYEGGAMGSEETLRQRFADDPARRRERAEENWSRGMSRQADRYRETLVRWYGEEKGKAVKYAEAFQICEYGRRPSPDQLRKLFPFFPEP
ncbi:MAG TPA: PIG-L family deacetylase [Thermoguttaceae bacterium]|nr:PIG-L family deacetylase [Thermoguttaceae bacterium]